jgi:hypothetical protein
MHGNICSSGHANACGSAHTVSSDPKNLCSRLDLAFSVRRLALQTAASLVT